MKTINSVVPSDIWLTFPAVNDGGGFQVMVYLCQIALDQVGVLMNLVLIAAVPIFL